MNRKQSAVSRRMAERENSTANNAVNDAIGDLNEQISNVTNTVNSTTDLAVLANNKADNILNTIDPNSLQSQVNVVVTDLTNLTNYVNNLPTAGGGGSGFDPSNPDEPIVYVENFVFHNAGDPDGDGTGPLPYPDVVLTTLNVLKFQVQTAPSEPDHIGIVKLKVQPVDTDVHALYLARRPQDTFVKPNEISTNTYIIKTPSDSDNVLEKFYLGLVESFTGPFAQDPLGLYIKKDNAVWRFQAKDSLGTTTVGSVAYSANMWFTIIIRRLNSNEFEATINETTLGSITTNIPTTYLNVGLGLQFGSFAFQDEFIPIDFFSLRIGEPETTNNGPLITDYVESINGSTGIVSLEKGQGIDLNTTSNAVTCNINFRFGGIGIPETNTGSASDLVLIQGKGGNAPMELITINNLLNTVVLATPITNVVSGKNFLVRDTSTNTQQVFAPGGSASSTTFLRGDGTWAIPTGGTAVINIDGGEPNTNYGGMNSLDGGNL